MGIAELIMDRMMELSEAQARTISKGWISDESKIEDMAGSDGRSISAVVRDPVAGMIGEWGGYLYLQSYGLNCEEPNCGIIKRDEGCWDKDLLALCDVRIINAGGVSVTAERTMSCKAQLLSQTLKFQDDEPSWTFQLPCIGKNGKKRNGDPMLQDPDCNKLLIVSWVNDYIDEIGHGNPVVRYDKFRVPYAKGFRWAPQVACFWWPDVYPYLDEPHNENLRGMKKCLYYKDIKHLRATIVE